MGASELLLDERQSRIQAKLAQSGRVLAVELALDFGVSEDTVRRDLREMAAAGLCKRVYGGALPPVPVTVSLSERDVDQPERKLALARCALGFIAPDMTVFLDASSVNMAIARLLASRPIKLTVVTNTPSIAALLLDAAEIDLIMIGGPIDRRISAAVGARALRDADVLRPDLCVLGVCGVDAVAGVTAHFVEDAEFKRLIAGRSRAVLLAVTNDKLGTVAPHDVIPMQNASHMIIEHDADGDVLAKFAALPVMVTRAAPV